MKDLNAYYTAVDREIFKLLDYFIELQHDFERRGGHDPDGPKKIEEFKRFRELVDDRAEQRRTVAEERAEEEQELMHSRTHVACPTCMAERDVRIIGKMRMDPPGALCDQVVCSVCGGEFIHQLPNNLKDRLKYAEFLLKVLTTPGKDGKPSPPLKGKEEAAAELIKRAKDLKEFFQGEELKEETREKARANADKRLVETRDLLLFWKLRSNNPAGQGAMA